MNDVHSLRTEYQHAELDRDDLPSNPFDLFATWFEDARGLGLVEPHAMALATVDPDGAPSCRMVLLRGIGEEGLSFYTNFDSRKGRALAHERRAAATFWWGALERQVRFEGEVAAVPEAEANAYFASRPRGSQLAAWASPQSAALADRGELAARLAAVEARFADGAVVPRPPFWGGFRLVPHSIEFWQGRPSRTHDRLVYRRGATAAWQVERLAP